MSNIHMRRFILGWKTLGCARRFGAEIVNCADDFCVLGKAPAATMLAVVNRVMERLKLPVNVRKTRCLRCPDRRYAGQSAEEVVKRLNRMLSGWANHFDLGQVSPAYKAVDRHATRRLRQWFSRKHKVRSGGYVRFPDIRLWNDCGLVRLGTRRRYLPRAKA